MTFIILDTTMWALFEHVGDQWSVSATKIRFPNTIQAVLLQFSRTIACHDRLIFNAAQ